MARELDAPRKSLLAAYDWPTDAHGWMCTDGVVEHYQDGEARAETYIRGVAKRLGRAAEVHEITGKTIAKREDPLLALDTADTERPTR